MKIAALRRPYALRIGENDGSSSSGWTNHTTSTWSLTFDLQNHRWHVDGPLREVSHDETDRKTDRKDHVPSKIKLWQKPELWLAEREGRSSSTMTLKQMLLVTQTHKHTCSCAGWCDFLCWCCWWPWRLEGSTEGAQTAEIHRCSTSENLPK